MKRLPKYEYGYAYDGGQRWKKDIVNRTWTWYPCGAACSAGELVELTSRYVPNRDFDPSLLTWTVSGLYLRGSGCGSKPIRYFSPTAAADGGFDEYHCWNLLDAAEVITDGTGAILAAGVYDAFGMARTDTNGNAVINFWPPIFLPARTRYRWGKRGDDGTNDQGCHGGFYLADIDTCSSSDDDCPFKCISPSGLVDRQCVSRCLGGPSPHLPCSPGNDLDCQVRCSSRGCKSHSCIENDAGDYDCWCFDCEDSKYDDRMDGRIRRV